MAATEAFGVTVKADFRDFERALLKAQNSTDAKLASIEKRFTRSNREVRQSTSSLAGAARAGLGELQGAISGAGVGLPGLTAGLGAAGAAGAAAAIGLGAAAIAMRGAIDAMKFADEIDDTAAKLAIGTDALQEFRFAMTEAGGEAKDFDAALASFQAKLGEGIAGGRSIKWFERLGFDQESLKAFDSTEAALVAVSDKVAGLGRASEQAAVANKLGLDGMLPLLRQGADGMEALRKKARDLGYVMDAELVAKGAAANQEFETMSHVIGVQMKSAFVDLSDEVLAFTGMVGGALSRLNDFIERFNALRGGINRLAGDGAFGNLVTGNIGGALGANLKGRIRSAREGNLRGALTGVGVGRRPQVTVDDMRALMGSPDAIPPAGELDTAATSGGRSGGRGASGPTAAELAARRTELERALAIEVARLEENEALVATLERERDVAQRTQQYEALKLSATEARLQATRDAAALDAARATADQRELRSLEVAHDIEVERLSGNERFAANIERRADFQAQILAFEKLGLDTATATNLAALNALEIDQARARIQARIIADAATEHEIQLARLRGDEEGLARLERSAEIIARARRIEADRGLNRGEGDALARQQVGELDAAAAYGRQRDMFRAAFRDGVMAALDGDLQGFLMDMGRTFLDGALDRMSGQLFDALFDAPQAAATGTVQGTAQGAAAGAAIAGAGATAAAAMGTAITTAGAAAAAAIGAAVAGARAADLSSLIPGRALGGPMMAGRPYIVGERRPEVVVPGVNSTVIPSVNAAMNRVQQAPPPAPSASTVRLIVEEGAMFSVRTAEIAGRIAVSTTSGAMRAAAEAEVMRRKYSRSRFV